MPVSRVMTRSVKTIEASRSVADCVGVMRENDIGCVVIVEREKPLGIFTERDLLRKVAEDPGSIRLQVQDVMSKPLKTILSSSTIWEAIKIMNNSGIRHLPIVEGEKLVGIVTQKDVVRLLFSNMDMLLKAIELEEMRAFMRGE